MIITIRRLLLLMAPFLLLVYYFGYADLHTYSMTPQYSEIQSRPESGQLEEVVADHVKRNAPTDQLELFLKHSSIIFRIANGIALQTDLMKKSIPIDDAIGEFLNFGDVKVSDVANFKGDNMSDFIGKLKSTPNSIDNSSGDLEKAALAWDELRSESENAKDARAPPLKADYFTALENFNNSFKYSLLDDIVGYLHSLIEKLNEISKIISKGDPDASKLSKIFKNNFLNLPDAIDDAVGGLESVTDLPKAINENGILGKSNEVFKPIEEAIRLRGVREKMKVKSSPGIISIMENNFRKAFELASAAASSLPQTVFLKKLTDFRVNSEDFQQKFTSGFLNGKHEIEELFADMQNKWIETASRGNITQIMLTQSLSPLSYFKSKLTEIDKAFGSTLDKQKLDSVVEIEKHQEELSKIKEESVNSASVIEKLEKCKKDGSNDFESSESEIIIGKAKELGEWLNKFNERITKMDIKKLKNETETFKGKIGFTDWTDLNGSPDQVPQALKNLKENNLLSNFKSMIEDIKKGISINVTLLQEEITTIKNGEDKVNSFDGLEEEINVHGCLQNLKTESELLAHAIKTTQNLKKLDTSKVDYVKDFESIVSVVIDVSEKVKDTSSIPARMIKEASSMTNETNRLPRNISEIIGSALTSLRSAHELKKLAAVSIPELKQIDSTIKSDLTTVSDPTKKQSIEDSWGNHDQDMTTLDEAIKQIDKVEVDMNLTQIKYINQYGKPFFQLTQLKNVNIDTKKKIQALDMLISTGTSSTKLEKSKATLSTIDSLDLQFSNHQTQFRQASMAFQNFYKFFVDITTSQRKKQAKPSSVIYAADPNAKQETDYVMIGGVAGGSLFIGGAIAVLLFVYFKFWRHRVNKNALRKWIRKQIFPDCIRKDKKAFDKNGKEIEYNEKYADAYRCHEALMKAMEIYVGRMERTFDYLPERKHRDGHGVNPETALHHLMKDGKKMPIHANWVIAPDGKKFIATCAPIKASKNRDDTIEDFWHMCILEKVEYIVMLCEEKEGCPQYYPTEIGKSETFGRYTVTLIMDGTPGDFDKILYRKFKITSKGGKSHTVTHFNYTGWPDQKPPENGDLTNVYELFQHVEKTNAPVVVHCMSGIGRTMTFIGVYTASEAVKLNPKLVMGDALAQLREARWFAIQTIRQSYWLQVAVCDKLNKDLKLGMDAEIKSMHDTFYEVAYNDRGPEEVMAPRIAIKKKKGKNKEDPNRDRSLDFGIKIQY